MAQIRSEIDVLISKVGDESLRADLRKQVARLQAKRTFGLVFESHQPERVRLPEHPLRPGVTVAYRDESDSPGFQVVTIKGKTATIRKVQQADGRPLTEKEAADVVDEKVPTKSLVVLAGFGEPIFPGLRSLGSVERGGSRPAHVVIKGENHHVLEALQFTHAGKVDCIYIDPPYNTGARDWKYDNNYVDENDAYRHSKWLAFMERRLVLAKRLLKPDDSVLIVTIDEKEYLRLGLLLEQTFPEAKIQMISSVVNRKGVPRKREFSRVDEYLFFLFFGETGPSLHNHDMLSETRPRISGGEGVTWVGLRRRGSEWRRTDRPGSFYPIFIRPETGQIVEVGEPLPLGAPRSSVPGREGLLTIWPLNSKGEESRWQLSPSMVRELLGEGMLKSSLQRGGQSVTLEYLSDGQRRQVLDGTIAVEGRDEAGALIVKHTGARLQQAKSVWNLDSHGATAYGTQLVSALLPGRRFPFPKSLYAVEDSIRFFVQDKPDAVVLDFFGGSGTTSHAVARLNKQDGGQRQSILITNNEVSAEESTQLRARGLQPGDSEWEMLGIFEHITRPRITTAITGRTTDGEPVQGDYKFTDEFPMSQGFEENVEFLELTYLDSEDVELDAAFSGIAPLLWLRAGARGPVIRESLDAAGRRKPYAWTERYGVLFNPDRWRTFVQKLPPSATTVFIVTDSQTTFAGIAAELPHSLDVVRLYENYLATFAINRGSF